MCAIALNKSSMQRERERKKLYERLLPSLDLKRRQLTIQLATARAELAARKKRLAEVVDSVGADIPMVAFGSVKLSGLVRITRVDVQEENIVGVRLPKLGTIDFEIADYSFFAKPPYVDAAIDRLKEAANARLTVRVGEERVRRMEVALRRVTQRVNLFDKKLIPEARQNIRRIQIALSDADRSAVVRSKLAKQKRQKECV